MSYTVKPLNTTGMSIRSDHTTMAGKIGTLGYYQTGLGSELYVSDINSDLQRIGDKWLRLTSPTPGWVAVIHLGVAYCTLTEHVDNPVPDVPTLLSVTITYTVNGIPYTETISK